MKTSELPVPLEHEEQVKLKQWWDYACSRWKLPPLALFAIPNAGAGAQKGQAGKMKAEGVRRGVPDLMLAVARMRGGKEWHGLFIEMKRTKGGRVEVHQQTAQDYLTKAGYLVQTCEGGDAAILAITLYLGEPWK